MPDQNKRQTDIHDQIKQIRDEEIKKDPPPYRLEMSTPSFLAQFHSPKTRLCKAFYKTDMLIYKQKICKRIRQRFLDIEIDLEIDIENADSLEPLYGKHDLNK